MATALTKAQADQKLEAMRQAHQAMHSKFEKMAGTSETMTSGPWLGTASRAYLARSMAQREQARHILTRVDLVIQKGADDMAKLVGADQT